MSTTLTVLILHNVESVYFFYSNPVLYKDTVVMYVHWLVLIKKVKAAQYMHQNTNISSQVASYCFWKDRSILVATSSYCFWGHNGK